MLVFDFIKDKLKKEELLSLYANKIEDIFATFYRQINFTCFERRLHAQENELSTEEINKIWMEESQKMFQDSVKLTKIMLLGGVIFLILSILLFTAMLMLMHNF